MMSEIFARGPISCSLFSDAPQFDNYKGGVITCPDRKHPLCSVTYTDHVVVIAGWGVDKTSGLPFWIGRNSYGSHWGEGAGGGWFRVERGVDMLGLESNACAWAVPAAGDVQRINDQYEAATSVE